MSGQRFDPRALFCCVTTKFVRIYLGFRSRDKDCEIGKIALDNSGVWIQYQFISFEGFTAFYFQALIFEIASNSQLVFKFNFKFKFVQRLFMNMNQVELFLNENNTEDF